MIAATMALPQNPIQSDADDTSSRLLKKNGVKFASDEELESRIGIYEEFEKAFSGLVIFGVFFEFFVAYLHPAYDSPRGILGPLIGDAFVAVGLAVEVFCGTRAKRLQSELTRRANEQLASVMRDVSEANERAAKLEEEAWVAKLETERLKDKMSSRSLDKSTFDKLVATLSKATKGRVTLVFPSGDPEAISYCAIFREAFRRGGWEVGVSGWHFTGAPVGIHVQHGTKWNAEIQAEMERVRDLLLQAGLSIEPRGVGMPSSGRLTEDIVVVIGHKPTPML